jgi:excisionase family DNA binding protein
MEARKMNAENQTAEWLRVGAVAKLLDVKPFTIVRLLNEGKLIGTYFGTREGWRVRRADLEALRGQLPTGKRDIMEATPQRAEEQPE